MDPNYKKLTPQLLETNPLEFYEQLTRQINISRQGKKDYISALKRIKNNISTETKTGKYAKQNRGEYAQDDYYYRLYSDLEVFLKKLIGDTYDNRERENSFARKMRIITTHILEKTDIGKFINSGEEYASMALAIYTDLTNRILQEYDKIRTEKDFKLDDISDVIIEQVEQEYLKQIQARNEKKLSLVQKSIIRPHSAEYKLVMINSKKIFNFAPAQGEELKNRMEKLSDINTEYEKDFSNITFNKIKKRTRGRMNDLLKKTTKTTRQELTKLTFTHRDKNSSQGYIAEYFAGIIGNSLSNKTTSLNLHLGAANKATDIFSFQINIDELLQPNVNQKIVNLYLNVIRAFSKMETHKYQYTNKEGYEKERIKAIKALNDSIDKAIENILQELEKEGIAENLFIFHESLKLYSSVETGKSITGFDGRELAILSALDSIYSSMEVLGINPPDKNLMILLALNLSGKSASHGQDVSHPLAKYLSIFCGLLMFDDTINIAKDAAKTIEELEQDKVSVLHLYKLNRIYVPGSLILYQIVNALEAAKNNITAGKENGFGARVKLDYNAATTIIAQWESERDKAQKEGKHYYEIKQWNQVASKIAANTTVKITFMSAFIKFISDLMT